MKFSIHCPLYARSVSAIGGLVAKDHNTAKFMGIQVEKDKSLILSVNKDEIVGKVVLSVDSVGDSKLFSVEEDGSVLVDGQTNVRILTKDSSNDKIAVSFVVGKTDNLKEGTLQYNYENGEKFGLQSVQENAAIKLFADEKPSAIFLGKELAKYALFASLYAGSAGGHPSYANLLFSAKDGVVTFAGTDGKQFGISSFKPETPVTEDFKVTVPHNLFTSVCKLLSADDQVEVCVSDDYIIFSQNLVYATAKVGETFFKTVTSKQDFVNYERTLNFIDFKTTAKFNRSLMARALSRLGAVRTKGCKMNVDVSRQEVKLETRDGSTFADNISVPMVEGKGADIEIVVAIDEFSKTLHQIEADNFEINFSGGSGIGMITLDDQRKAYFTPYRG